MWKIIALLQFCLLTISAIVYAGTTQYDFKPAVFFDKVPDDYSGSAVLFIDKNNMNFVYIGEFENGKRHGQGSTFSKNISSHTIYELKDGSQKNISDYVSTYTTGTWNSGRLIGDTVNIVSYDGTENWLVDTGIYDNSGFVYGFQAQPSKNMYFLGHADFTKPDMGTCFSRDQSSKPCKLTDVYKP